MPTRILFLTLTIVLLKSNISHAQKSSLKAIDSICRQIDLDTTIKWKSISKGIIQHNNLCVCDDMTYHFKNNMVSKVTTYVLHVAIVSSAYYFKDKKLIFAISTKKHDGKTISQTKYYFAGNKLLKTLYVVGNHPKDNKEMGKYILTNAQTYIHFLSPDNE